MMIEIFSEYSGFVPDKKKISMILKKIFIDYCVIANFVNVIFTDDETLKQTKHKYFKENRYTDVISFCLSLLSEPLEGEIYISVDRAQAQSKIFHIDFENEIFRLVIHGALHLCGLDDKTKMEKQKMKNCEDYYLSEVFTR